MSNSIAGKTFALFPDFNNKKIVSELENAHLKVYKFPVIETEKTLSDKSNEIITNLKRYDWIIFPDVLAVDFFLGILEENNIDFFDLDEIRVCAFGEAVSDRLRFVQLHADVIPNTLEPETVLAALKNYIAASEFENLRFLLPKESSAEIEIKKELAELNAEIDELPVYRIQIAERDELSKLKALLKGGAIDEFVFCSPTDFIALDYIFNNEPLERIFADVKVSAIDNSVFQTAREHNLKCSGLFQFHKTDKVEK